MTECERLIEKKYFSMDYFREEVRDEFLVDETRKKVWAIGIDLLLQVDRICKKYGFQYYLMYGSLLGAIRHKGFIPWDDDIDIAMPRKDYEEFLKVAAADLDAPYFLQTPETDCGYYYSFAKLRNSNTTGMIPWFRYSDFNMGFALDIFPVDVCKLEGVEDRFHIIKKMNIDNSTYMRMKNPDLSEADKLRVSQYRGGDPLVRYHEIQRIAMQFEEERDEVSQRIVAVATVYDYQKQIFDASDVENVLYVSFEGFKFPIPVGYDKILKTLYGDYMAFPPVEKRGTWHRDKIIDPDKSYREYLKSK
jgi:lipopolysaccharide cholinephosphotransferase